MYGGSGISPLDCKIDNTSPSSNTTRRRPAWVDSRIVALTDSPITTFEPGLVRDDGRTRASHSPSPSSRNRKISSLPPVSFSAFNRARITRVSLSARQSPDSKYFPTPLNTSSVSVPASRSNTNSRDSERFGVGSCAMSSSGSV